MDESVVLDLVGTIYDAAYDGIGWAAYLDLLRARTGASGAVFMGCDFARGDSDAAHFGEYVNAPDIYEKYREHYWRVDAFYAAGAQWAPGVHCSNEVIPDRELERTEFGNDFLLAHDLFYFAGGMLFAAESTLVWCGAVRSRRQGPPDNREMQLHRALHPHLQQALRIDSRMRQLRASRATSGDLIDGLPYGLVGLDRTRRLLFLNRIAEDIVVESAGLRLGPRGLCGLRPHEDELLQVAIARALDLPPTASTVVLPRPSSPRPLRITVAPAQRNGAPLPAIFPTPAVLLFLHDPDRVVAPPVALLRSLYGLTAREAELATWLARGAGVAQAAEALQVTPKTAANYLRQVFRKTGTRRQADLVRLLAVLPNVGGLDGIVG